MEFSFEGVSRLRFPITVDGLRTYKSSGGGWSLSPFAIFFKSPSGVEIGMTIQVKKNEVTTNQMWISVDGVPISDHCLSTDTTGLEPPSLRAIIEQAIVDIEGEEKRIDPTGRHAKARKTPGTPENKEAVRNSLERL